MDYFDLSNFLSILDRIKSASKASSDRETAEILGITPSHLNNVKRAAQNKYKGGGSPKNIPLRQILEWGKQENINLHWLLTGEGSPESTAVEKPKAAALPNTLEDFQRWAVSACEKDPKLEQWLSIELNIIKNRAALNTPQIKGGDDD